MTTPNDADYFLRREIQERDLAAKSVDVAVAAIHAEMADGYARRASKVRPKLHVVHKGQAPQNVAKPQAD